MFEKALRNKYRFPSVRGDLTTEQLWALPLESKDGFDLDAIAQALHASLEAAGTVSFVKKTTAKQESLKDRLEIVKYVIETKLKEAEDRVSAKERLDKRRKLEEILAEKQDDALKNMTEEEIQAELKKLEA